MTPALSADLERPDLKTLTRANSEVAKAEERLLEARWHLLEVVVELMDEGYTQSAIARSLSISNVTLHQKLKRAGLLNSQRHPVRRGSRRGKQGKHPSSKASK